MSRTVSSQVRIQPGLGVLLRAALELVDLLERGLAARARAGRRPRRGRGSRREPSGSPSPSSLRIAASCWRSRNSRCCFSMPSRTSLPIFSRDLLLGDVLLGPADQQLEPALARRSRRAAAPSARRRSRTPNRRGRRAAPGSVVRSTLSITCHAPRCCRMRHDQGLVLLGELEHPPGRRRVGDGSASTHRAAPGPVTPDPIRARTSPRTTAAFSPLGSRPTCSRTATVPTAA